jgi:hypothetical protein
VLRARVGYWYCSARVARQTKRALARTVDADAVVSASNEAYTAREREPDLSQ